jgi:Flp pilus assembly protein TadD
MNGNNHEFEQLMKKGWEQGRLGLFADAAQTFAQAVRIKPDSAYALLALGRSLTRAGR